MKISRPQSVMGWSLLITLVCLSIAIAAVNLNVNVKQTTVDTLTTGASVVGKSVDDYAGGLLDSTIEETELEQAKADFITVVRNILDTDTSTINKATAELRKLVPKEI